MPSKWDHAYYHPYHPELYKSSGPIEPFELTSDLRTLINRAIDDPTSITPAERNVIRLLPPPDEEDRFIRKKLPSKSKAELVSKAVASPELLTWEEAQYLLPKPIPHDFKSVDDRELILTAITATRPSDEQEAISNA